MFRLTALFLTFCLCLFAATPIAVLNLAALPEFAADAALDPLQPATPDSVESDPQSFGITLPGDLKDGHNMPPIPKAPSPSGFDDVISTLTISGPIYIASTSLSYAVL